MDPAPDDNESILRKWVQIRLAAIPSEPICTMYIVQVLLANRI